MYDPIFEPGCPLKILAKYPQPPSTLIVAGGLGVGVTVGVAEGGGTTTSVIWEVPASCEPCIIGAFTYSGKRRVSGIIPTAFAILIVLAATTAIPIVAIPDTPLADVVIL